MAWVDPARLRHALPRVLRRRLRPVHRPQQRVDINEATFADTIQYRAAPSQRDQMHFGDTAPAFDLRDRQHAVGPLQVAVEADDREKL